MPLVLSQNKVECNCAKCGKTLGAASAVGLVFLWCRFCKKETIFTIQIEPDCLRVTAFIENSNLNEKTVSNRPVSVHA